MRKIGAGGRFDKDTYNVSGGRHGGGVSGGNAVSLDLKASVYNNGKEWEQEYSQGKIKSEVREVGPSTDQGTMVTFLPDPEIDRSSCPPPIGPIVYISSVIGS